ncbi:uncharacterized protein METZ01_LOCUS171416, partial [marine metagenome]
PRAPMEQLARGIVRVLWSKAQFPPAPHLREGSHGRSRRFRYGHLGFARPSGCSHGAGISGQGLLYQALRRLLLLHLAGTAQV